MPATRSERLHWIPFFILAILLHLLVFSIRFSPSTSPSTIPSLPIETLSPKELSRIKSSQKEKALLLSKRTAMEQSEAPADARYFSDRNIRVEKEQRAKEGGIFSKGRKGNPGKKRVDLSQLGIPYHFSPPEVSRSGPQTGYGEDLDPYQNQSVDDQNVPLSGENLLNAEQSVYYSFYSRMYEIIGRLWQNILRSNPPRRVLPGDYRTEVDVALNSNGDLLEVRILQSSGVREFDQAVENTFNRIGQFPHPPQGLLNSSNEVHTKWSFRVQVGQGLDLFYAPPRREY